MNSKSAREGGRISMYSKSKRFIAGFLAVLMAVTLLPANAAGVAYAEELDAIETEAADSVVVTDDEAEAADSVAVTDEETESDAIVDEETPQASEEEAEPEDGLALEEETPALEEAVAEVEEDAAADVSLYDGEAEVYSEGELSTDLLEISGDFFTTAASGMVDTENIGGSIYSYKKGSDTNSKAGTAAMTASDGKELPGYIELGKSGNKTQAVITFTATEDGVLTVYTRSAGSAARSFALDTDDGTTSQSTLTAPSKDGDVAPQTANITAGDYYLYNNTSSGGARIYGISLKYSDTAPPVDLTGATVGVSITDGEQEKTSVAYTGSPVEIKTTVTLSGGTTPNKKAYTVSYLRKDNEGNFTVETEDLTSVGEIKVKVTSGEGADATEAESTDVIEITKATLETEDKNVLIDETKLAQYASATVDLDKLVTPLSDDDTFTYALSTDTDKGYAAGDIVDGTPSIDGSVLTYSAVQTAPETGIATVLVVEVTSDNYETAYIKITVDIVTKTAVTVSGNSVEKEYDGTVYGFKAKADIAVTGVADTDLADAIADIKANITYKFKKAEDTAAAVEAEPTDAGVYEVSAELSDNSAYSMTKYEPVTLTITKKAVTIKPKDTTWDKLLKAHPTAKAATDVTAADYTFVDDKGLVTGDAMTAQPAIKYCKTGTETELTEDDWAALQKGDTVDIVASGADAGSNYDIAYAAGTLTVAETTLTPLTAIPAAGASVTGTDAKTAGLTTTASTEAKTINGFVLGIGMQADTNGSGSNAVDRIKTGGTGNVAEKSIGFKIDNPATLTMDCSSASSDVRKIQLVKLNDDKTITECVGVMYQAGSAAKAAYNTTDKLPANASWTTVKVDLTEAGSYYIYSPNSGVNFKSVAVAYVNTSTKTALTKEMVTIGGQAVTEDTDGKLTTGYTAEYDNAAVEPAVEVKVGTATAVQDTDYTVTFADNDKVGTAKVTVAPKDGSELLEGSALEISFEITAKDDRTALADAVVTVGGEKAVADANGKYSSNAWINLAEGKAEPAVAVTVGEGDNAKTAVQGTDYTVEYANNTAAGEAKVTITPKADSTLLKGAAMEVSFTVRPEGAQNTRTALTAEMVKVEGEAVTKGTDGKYTTAYNPTETGSAITPAVVITVGEGDNAKTAVKDTDYTVAYADNTAAGTAKITITPAGGSELLEGAAMEISFTIKAQQQTPPSGGDIEVVEGGVIKIVGVKESYDFTGAKITPDFDVVDEAIKEADGEFRTLKLGVDYTAKYKNNQKAGTATIMVTGKGNYVGKDVSKDFTIKAPEFDTATETPTDIKGAKITTKIAPVTYNGKAQHPDFTLKLKGGTEVNFKWNDETKEYTNDASAEAPLVVRVTVSNNTNKGTATILVTGAAGSNGKATSAKKTFKINAADISSAVVTYDQQADGVTAPYAVKGAAATGVTVKYTHEENGTPVTLVPGKDYTIKYSANKKPGEASFTVTGKGNYAKKTDKQKFTVAMLNIADLDITAATVYDGIKAGKVKATVVDGNGDILKASDYTVKVYKSNTADAEAYDKNDKIERGEEGLTVYVGVEAKSNSKNLTGMTATPDAFTVGLDISKAKVKFVGDYKSNKGLLYTGAPLALKDGDLEVTLKGASAPLTMANGDFEIVYSNNVNKGTAIAVIKGTGAYSGTKTVKFKIVAKTMKGAAAENNN